MVFCDKLCTNVGIWALLLGAVGDALRAGEPQRITQDGQFKFALVFVLGGKEVVFSVHDVPSRVSLMRMSLQNGIRKLLYP